MIDRATANRIRTAKTIADDARTDAGTRAAARNRYDALVSKYGDPDARPAARTPDSDNARFRETMRTYREGQTSPGASAWGRSVNEDIIRQFAETLRSSQPDFADSILHGWMNAGMSGKRAEFVFVDDPGDIAHARANGRRVGEAVTWLIDSEGYEIEGIAGGPWTLTTPGGATFGPLDMGQVLKFARSLGFPR